MKFLRVQCFGLVNSFRQPDFHTYHKTLPLPHKTTIAGFLGSGLGISPREVNDDWLISQRFSVGIVGKSDGYAKDLWQIRKYKSTQIKSFEKGKAQTPYITAVIVRELLFYNEFTLYFHFNIQEDYSLIAEAIKYPAWALSLGREDELVLIKEIKIIELPTSKNLSYQHTVLPYDISESNYDIGSDNIIQYGVNLMNRAPSTVNLPIDFEINDKTEVRQPLSFQKFTYVHNVPVIVEEDGFWDEELNIAFQTL